MARRFLFYSFSLSIVMLVSCGNSPEEYTPEQQTIRFVELSYGVCNLEPEKAESGDEGQTFSQNFVITDKTDTVPAKIGSRFGISYMIESSLEDAVELRRAWIFPEPMRDDDGDVYIGKSLDIRRTPNDETTAYYTLEHPYEIIKGKWQLCFYYKKHLLYRKIFLVI